MYGGAAGGGKSDALLMAALQFAEVPEYAALILRRSLVQLKKPGALLDRARDWLHARGSYNASEYRWRFPAGSTLQFGYCDNEQDVRHYLSSEFQFIGIDEATEFTEYQIRYLFSRLRRRRSIPVPLRFRLASNPGGVGHEFVKRRYITEPGERVYIPARLDDNPGIDAREYLSSLAELDPITRAQLLAGDWDAYQGGRFRREWFRRYRRHGTSFLVGDRIIEYPLVQRFATVDPAASSTLTAKSADPDYTVVSVWGVTPALELLWLDCWRFRKEIPDIVPEVQRIYDEWALSYVAIETVAANRAVYQIARRTPMAVREVMPLGLDKLVRATKAMVLAESGRLYLPVAAPWLDDAEAELLRFTGDEKRDAHDDIVDTVAYAAHLLTTREDQQHRGFRPYTIGGG